MYIATIATDLKLHTWATGQHFGTYRPPECGLMRSLSWSKEGDLIVVVPRSSWPEILTVENTEVKSIYTINKVKHSTCAAFQNLSSRYVAVGTNTGDVKIYDIKTRHIKKQFPKTPAPVSKLQYGMNDSFLVAGCENGEIVSFNTTLMNSSELLRIPRSKTVSAMRTHSSRKDLLIAGSEQGIIAVWDVSYTSMSHMSSPHSSAVTDVAFSPTHPNLLLSCGMDRRLAFTDTTSWTPVLEQRFDCFPTAIDILPDGIRMVMGTQSGLIYAFDTRQMCEPVTKIKAHHSQVVQILFQKHGVNESGDYDYRTVCETPMKNNGMYETYNSNIDIQGDLVFNAMNSDNSINDNRPGPISRGVKKLLNSKSNLLDTSSDPLLDLQNRPSTSVMRFNDKEVSKGEHQHEQNSMIIGEINQQTLYKNPSINNIQNFNSQTQYTSTPNSGMQETNTPNGCNISPILDEKEVPLDYSELREIVENAVKKEIKDQLDEFYESMKYDMMDMLGHMSKNVLNTQMMMIKEFVQIEQIMNKMKEFLASDERITDELVVQENLMLKQEVDSLKQQLLARQSKK